MILAVILIVLILLVVLIALVLLVILILVLVLILHNIIPPIFTAVDRYITMPLILGFILGFEQNTCN